MPKVSNKVYLLFYYLLLFIGYPLFAATNYQHLQYTFTLILDKREWGNRANPPYMPLFLWKFFSIYSWFFVYFKDGTSLVGQKVDVM